MWQSYVGIQKYPKYHSRRLFFAFDLQRFHAVQKCHACQIYNWKQHTPLTPLHLVITVGPFQKWGIEIMTSNPHSVRGHGYIIVAMDYFTKWSETMPTYDVNGKTISLFLFNHVIAQFGVPKAIVTNHGSHFRNYMITKLTAQLGLYHDSSTPYYPQANGQVEVVNKFLVTILQRTIGMHKKN